MGPLKIGEKEPKKHEIVAKCGYFCVLGVLDFSQFLQTLYNFYKIGHKIGHIMYRFSFVWRSANVAKSTLQLSLRSGSKKSRLATGVVEDPSTFDIKAQRFLRSNKSADLLNEQLAKWETEIARLCRVAGVEGWSLERLIDSAALVIQGDERTLGDKIKDDVLSYYAKWVNGKIPDKKPSASNLYHYNTFCEYFKEKKKRHRPAFEEIDYSYLSAYADWLKARDLKRNTIGSHIKDLKAVVNSAARFGLHNSAKCNAFHTPAEEVDNIRLNMEDISKIREFKTDDELLSKVRDLFLLGLFTAMRFSDYSRLTVEDIQDKEVIIKRQQKTKQIVSIPIAPITREIITRYQGAPQVGQIVFNRLIKKMCFLAGIRDKVAMMVDGKTVYVFKYTKISSHTARRTAAYQLIKSGENVYNVMRLLGHKSVQTTLRYIGISNEENAQMMANADYFRNAL